MTELFTDTVLNMMTTTAEPEDYTGEDGLLYCGKCRTPKEAYFRRAALAAVKQTVLARVVLRLCGSSHHIQNGIAKKFSHKLSPSLKV